ncbi:hypothetical protein BLOT_004917, partial [Blomia tropicalis]
GNKEDVDSSLKVPSFANDEHLKQCNKTVMDKMVRWLFFFNDPHRILPRNTKEFEEFCDEKSRIELYVTAYARRCLPKFPRQVTSLLMFGIARKNRYYCNFVKGKSDIIQGAKCINTIKETGAQCLTQTINDLMAIRHAPTDGKIAKTCCTYYRLEECLVHKTQEDHKVCTPKDAKRMEELLEGYSGQMINHVCAKYPKDLDHCAKLLSKRELSKLRKISSKNKEESYSILQPMIDILDSIPP